jgi:diaminohydroxyphosphoribosylaminopyrimidine deaminase/5-amino-6-(5-phosphoribosylamino)uracil reductase
VIRSQQDALFMARAIQLAQRGKYTTDPNPRVGCVIVKHGRVIGEGWHSRAGQAHAEIDAINKADEIEGATVYVTLEPCSHYGKTPPCCDALIKAKVKRVVAAMLDPNPLVAGKSIKRLQAAGIEVTCGVLEQDAVALNPGFIKRMTCGRPLVISKLAMSLDGRTAMASGESKWITSSAARLDVQRLRAASSAILTGINTVLADDPSLNVRLDKDVEQPVRVVLDSTLKMPVNARMVTLPGRSLIMTCAEVGKKSQSLERAGFAIHHLQADAEQRVDLAKVMDLLCHLKINTVLVEAGAVVNGALLTQGLVDEWVIYMAPVVMGDNGRGLFNMPWLQKMADKINLQITEVRQIGPDLRIKFVV